MKRILGIALLCVVSINAFAFDITMDLKVIGNDQKLILNVKTNLPPKTILAAVLARPTNQGGDFYAEDATAAVLTNQVVQFGPFPKAGGRLSPGIYKVTVTALGSWLQPEEIQPLLGERLTGPLVLTIPGASERLVSQKFQFKINPDGSISTPPPSNLQPTNSQPSKHQAVDGLAGGSPDDIWQKVQSDGREISVMMNGRYYSAEPNSGHAFQSADGKTTYGWDSLTKHASYGFHTYIVANLPESTIVGAPQSVMHEVEGDCETRHYHVLGHLFFAGKNRSGVAMQSMPPEDVERNLVPNSPFEKAFDMLCKIARDQK
jgi:hypothetical protein